jgi:hypothetical protein
MEKEDVMNRVKIVSLIALTAVLVLGTGVVAYARYNANPAVLPPTSRIEGLTYGEWLAKWWYYALTIPASQNPLSGATGSNCVVQREGNVGLVLANSTLTEPISCEVPPGMMLFVEVLGAECSTLEAAPFYGANEQELQACAQGFVPQELAASIDGRDVKNLGKYVVISPAFKFAQLEDNLLEVPPGSTGQSVGSGAYLMIAPLSAGSHTVHLHGVYPDLEYTADKVIKFSVKP